MTWAERSLQMLAQQVQELIPSGLCLNAAAPFLQCRSVPSQLHDDIKIKYKEVTKAHLYCVLTVSQALYISYLIQRPHRHRRERLSLSSIPDKEARKPRHGEVKKIVKAAYLVNYRPGLEPMRRGSGTCTLNQCVDVSNNIKTLLPPPSPAKQCSSYLRCFVSLTVFSVMGRSPHGTNSEI